ncbi:MAG: hypothetical protein IPJ77_00275 [Planctomycetes bacterium]|nr:hypothetical protein [Planctomycetota bacterium]
MTWQDWSCLAFVVGALGAFWYFVIDGRRDDMGHRVPLWKRVKAWCAAVFELFWSS